jgi:hypothetical protein
MFLVVLRAKNFHPTATLDGQSGHILHRSTEKEVPLICVLFAVSFRGLAMRSIDPS